MADVIAKNWAIFQVFYGDNTSIFCTVTNVLGVSADVTVASAGDQLYVMTDNNTIYLDTLREPLKLGHLYVWSTWLDMHKRDNNVIDACDVTEDFMGFMDFTDD